MHQTGAPGKLVSAHFGHAPDWCADVLPMHQVGAAGVLFLYHTTSLGFQWGAGAEAQTIPKLDVLSYNLLIFLYFLYRSNYLYSNKTGCEKCILSRKNAPKFLFLKKKVCLI